MTTPNVVKGVASGAGGASFMGPINQCGGQIHTDYVFEPSYKLELIQEHAEYMWENKHLKAIPKPTIDENGKDMVELGAQGRVLLKSRPKPRGQNRN